MPGHYPVSERGNGHPDHVDNRFCGFLDMRTRAQIPLYG
jgi:hypothetical protein